VLAESAVVEARPSVVFPVTSKIPDTERLVVDALVIVPLVIVVVARLTVPVAVNVPATRLVVVALVAVRLVKNAVTPFKIDAKRLDEVLFVVDAFVAKKLVVVLFVDELFTILPFVAKKLVLVLFVVDALRAERVPVVVLLVDTILPTVVCPVTESVPVATMLVAEIFEVDALPRNEVAETIDVKIGLGETATVEVDERTMLDPAVRNVTGEL
jgi:hypothetical protein